MFENLMNVDILRKNCLDKESEIKVNQNNEH